MAAVGAGITHYDGYQMFTTANLIKPAGNQSGVPQAWAAPHQIRIG